MTKHGFSGSAFIKSIRDVIKQYDMLRPGDSVLVAVSGGPDSLCLLRVLLEMKKALGVELVTANMDHGIRGRESKQDSDFVRGLSKELGLACAHRKIELTTRRKNRKSLEEHARQRRYAFFKQAAGKYRCNVVATGHTLDDQAETVLLRLLTGASLRGIAGIPPVRYADDLKIIRPLIRTPKKAVLDYMRAGGWKYREDRTNNDRKYLRNRIRHEVLPFLEKYNPRVRRSLANLCDTIREDLEFIETKKASAVDRYSKSGERFIRIGTGDMILQPRALRKEIFKELFARAGGNTKKLTYRHWRDMDYLIRAGETGKSLDLPGGVMVTKARGEIEFKKRRRRQ